MVELLEVTPTSLAYICLGGFVVTFSVFSLLVKEKAYVNEVVLGTGFGILMGPICAGILDPRSWAEDNHRLTLEVMRLVLATGLFAIGIELPKSYMYRHARGLIALVVPTMAIGWVIVAALLKAIFSQFNFITCLAIASCLTPTDPIISAAIIGGRFARNHVPLSLRQILAAESAANDGLAYPFLSISLYLTLDLDRRRNISNWVLVGWLYQVFLGTFIGAVIGYLFAHIMKFSHRRGFIDRESYVAQYLALAIFTMGIVNTIGSDDLLAAFAAGCAVSWDGDFNMQTEGETFTSVIEYMLNCACFFYIGAWIRWSDFTLPEIGITPWRLVVLCIGILFLRRIPALLALYRWVPEISSWKEALFVGHFGPMGVGAIFISTLALHRLPEPRNPPESQQDILAKALHPIVTFVVLFSIVIHGLSIPFFNAGKNLHSRTISMKTPPDWFDTIRRSTQNDVALPTSISHPSPQAPPPAVLRDVGANEMEMLKYNDPEAHAISVDGKRLSTGPQFIPPEVASVIERRNTFKDDDDTRIQNVEDMSGSPPPNAVLHSPPAQ